MASHKSTYFFIDNARIDVDRGQLARSQYSLAKKWRWSRQNIRTFLKLLESQNMITLKSNPHTTIITICNYCKYQDIILDGNPRPTHGPPTGNPRVTIYNNENNENNENKLKDSRAGALEKNPKKEPDGKDCESIFLHWQAVTGHPQSKFTDTRKKLIKKMLSLKPEPYTPIQLKLAIDGHNKSQYHKKNNYMDLTYTFRDTNIDKFIQLAGMTDAELNRLNDKRGIDWDDTTWADGLSAEYGVRDRHGG